MPLRPQVSGGIAHVDRVVAPRCASKMFRPCATALAVSATLCAVPAFATAEGSAPSVLSLYGNGTQELDAIFEKVYGHFASTFDHAAYERLTQQFGKGTVDMDFSLLLYI